MKKVLLGTSAVALVGAMTTASNAAEWDIKLGGYMEQHIGYMSNDTIAGEDFDGVHSFSDQEFFFRPEITLDNGIKISARMDFEGQGNQSVDEPRMIISGSFGSLILGEDDDAASDVVVTAPEVDFMGIVSGSEVNYLPGVIVPQDGAARGPFTNLGGDAVGIKYFTPRLAGFQVGASYSRDSNQAGTKGPTDIDAVGTENNTLSAGANYSGSFGGVDIALGGGYSTQNVATATGDSDQSAWNAGASIGVAGFTIGGGYSEIMDNGDEGFSYAAGIAYETGPWGVSVTYLHGESDNAAVTSDDEVDMYKIAASYKLGKGVSVMGFGMYVDEDDASTTTKFSATSGTGDLESFVVGTGIKASF